MKRRTITQKQWIYKNNKVFTQDNKGGHSKKENYFKYYPTHTDELHTENANYNNMAVRELCEVN